MFYSLQVLKLNLIFLLVLISNFIALQGSIWLGQFLLVKILLRFSFFVAKIYNS